MRQFRSPSKNSASPALFISHLSQALFFFSNLLISSPEGVQVGGRV